MARYHFEPVKSEKASQAGMSWLVVEEPIRFLIWNGRLYEPVPEITGVDEVQKRTKNGLRYVLLYQADRRGKLLGMKLAGKTFKLVVPEAVEDEEDFEEIEL